MQDYREALSLPPSLSRDLLVTLDPGPARAKEVHYLRNLLPPPLALSPPVHKGGNIYTKPPAEHAFEHPKRSVRDVERDRHTYETDRKGESVAERGKGGGRRGGVGKRERERERERGTERRV
jgi:hypothetical protein